MVYTMKLPEVVITERDATMFEMKKSGLSYRQIGKALGVSESTAYRGCKRTSDRIVKQLAIDHGQEIILDIQRCEGIISSFLPLTKWKKMQTPDGEEIEIPPSPDAANIVLKIMDRRARLIGLDQNNILEISMNGSKGAGTPDVGTSEDGDTERTPEDEARKLLRVFREAGVLDEKIFEMLKGTGEEVIDAEVVEDVLDEGRLALETASFEPPAYDDDYDDEMPDSSWKPEDV